MSRWSRYLPRHWRITAWQKRMDACEALAGLLEGAADWLRDRR